MITIAAIALRLGVAQRTVKLGLATLVVLVLVLGAGIAKCTYDRNLISNHDAGVNVEIATGARSADMTADEAAAPREAQHAAEAANVQEAIHEAVKAHPDAVKRPSGPATNAALDRLRANAASRDR